MSSTESFRTALLLSTLLSAADSCALSPHLPFLTSSAHNNALLICADASGPVLIKLQLSIFVAAKFQILGLSALPQSGCSCHGEREGLLTRGMHAV